MITVVSGLPRSGTSMMMAMLEAGGLPCFYDDGQFYESAAGLAGQFGSVPDGHAVKCLEMLPLSAPADVRVIVMRRELATIAASANARLLERGGLPRPSGDLEGNLDAIRLWCSSRPHLEVWKEDVHRNTAYECQRVARMLGVPLDLAAMASVPVPRSH